MSKIRVYNTATEEENYPADLSGLTYEEAVTQLNLFEQGTNHCTPYREAEDILLLTYSDEESEIYSIEED